MKTATINQAEVINDLLRINMDRVEGYRKAANETKDTDMDLRQLFNTMADQSQAIAGELRKQLDEQGETPVTDTSLAGKLYRTWMGVKATFTGKDRKDILSSCEYGEDAAQKAYNSALEDRDILTSDLRELLMDQQRRLKQSHDHIKRLRNQEK
ncbi:MAG: PA2169 family four-helix-bundle protein [Chitinophagaceae bacterium]|nr:PA2169 family four-helix-bundle protein [Chitinophagaceae bacterium]